jgi:transcription elongation factor GreA
MISITSPIGRALIGKQVDEEAVVRAPGGIREFLVLDIS